jgi:quinol monooxygenase YgiN
VNTTQLLILGASVLASIVSGQADAQEANRQYVQVAEIDVDPAQLEQYEAAVREQIEAAIRAEPGVLVLYAVAAKDNPAHVTVFEIYASIEAYRAHLEAPHFKKYKATVETMVTSLKLVQSTAIALGAKGK